MLSSLNVVAVFALALIILALSASNVSASNSNILHDSVPTHNGTAIAMALVTELWTGGLLRLPRFLRMVISNIEEQQEFREANHQYRSLLNPSININDVVYATIIGIFLFFLRIQMQNRIMPKLFPRQTPKLIGKLTEDLYYTAYYTIAFGYFLMVVLPNVDWGSRLWSNDSIISYDLLHPTHPVMSTVERWYYIQASGFYLSAWMFLTMYDSRRSDFMQYVVHHFVTIGMIVVSYLYSYVRVGMVVLALHDVGDIFLYSSKFCHHLGIQGVDIALFAIFAVTFYVGRMVLFSRIVHTITVEALQVLVVAPTFNNWSMYYDTYLPHYGMFTIALNTLLGLHCYWFMLVLRLIADELFYGKKITEQGDLRSDDEDDEPLSKHED